MTSGRDSPYRRTWFWADSVNILSPFFHRTTSSQILPLQSGRQRLFATRLAWSGGSSQFLSALVRSHQRFGDWLISLLSKRASRREEERFVIVFGILHLSPKQRDNHNANK